MLKKVRLLFSFQFVGWEVLLYKMALCRESKSCCLDTRLHLHGVYSNKVGCISIFHNHLTRSTVTQSHVLPINCHLRWNTTVRRLSCISQRTQSSVKVKFTSRLRNIGRYSMENSKTLMFRYERLTDLLAPDGADSLVSSGDNSGSWDSNHVSSGGYGRSCSGVVETHFWQSDTSRYLRKFLSLSGGAQRQRWDRLIKSRTNLHERMILFRKRTNQEFFSEPEPNHYFLLTRKWPKFRPHFC